VTAQIIETVPCIRCNETSTITVDADAHRRWTSGELIQDAFPDMTADRRELLISGTHSACLDAMFNTEEEELESA
jgi:hypothetical protein